MPSNIGTQTVTLKWLTEAASRKVNERYHEVRPTGIYRGGYLSAVDATNITVSPLVCEIADDANGYQVRVETAATVTINEATLAGKYIVLRWDYTGSATVDYMALLAVAVGSIRVDDLIVGYCISASNFDYGNAVYRRSNPKTFEHFLKVDAPDSVAMAAAPMKVRVRDGQIHTTSAAFLVDDQPTPSSFTTPASGTEYGLVYLDADGAVQIVDNDGETSVPDFVGKNVLAIVTITDSDTIITQSMITDVRNWIASSVYPDNSSIQRDSDGKFQQKHDYLTMYSDSIQAGSKSSYTKLSLTTKKQSGISVSSSVVTLAAGKSYKISYSVQFEQIAESPECEVRLNVLSGDTTWDLGNISHQLIELAEVSGSIELATLTGTYFIIPSSTTTFRLEVITLDHVIQTARVVECSLQVWSG